MKKNAVFLLGLLILCFLAAPASATLIGVSGPLSTVSTGGVAPEIISAPTNILDDDVINRGMQGFNEVEGGDSYALIASNILLVNMLVTEPGDWIRVVTEAKSVQEPGTILLLGLGIIVVAIFTRKIFQS